MDGEVSVPTLRSGGRDQTEAETKKLTDDQLHAKDTQIRAKDLQVLN